jgi:hypothetical protein
MRENALRYVAGISEKQEDSSAREFGRKKKRALIQESQVCRFPFFNSLVETAFFKVWNGKQRL